jgi:hypothetical protein
MAKTMRIATAPTVDENLGEADELGVELEVERREAAKVSVRQSAQWTRLRSVIAASALITISPAIVTKAASMDGGN